MKNIKVILGIAAVLALIVVLVLYVQSKDDKTQTVTTNSGQVVTIPTRIPEINGTVLKIEGNELVVNRVISTLTAEEQASRKAMMQSLSIEERQALRGQENENAPTEQVTVIIPVGIPIVVGTGDLSGTVKLSSLTDIKIGSNLSIWKSGEVIELVKIKGL